MSDCPVTVACSNMSIAEPLPLPRTQAHPAPKTVASQLQPPMSVNTDPHDAVQATNLLRRSPVHISRTQDLSPLRHEDLGVPPQSCAHDDSPAPFHPPLLDQPMGPSSPSLRRNEASAPSLPQATFTPPPAIVNDDNATSAVLPSAVSHTSPPASSAPPTARRLVPTDEPSAPIPSSTRMLATSDSESDFDTDRDLPATAAKIAAMLNRPKVAHGGPIVP